MRLKKLTAVALTATLTIGSLFTGTTVKAQTNSNQVATYAEDSQTTYPWYKTAQATTGDYIADSYEGVERGHVFESVAREITTLFLQDLSIKQVRLQLQKSMKLQRKTE